MNAEIIVDGIAGLVEAAAPFITAIPGAQAIAPVALPLISKTIRLIGDAILRRKTDEQILLEYQKALDDAETTALTRRARLKELDSEIDSMDQGEP